MTTTTMACHERTAELESQLERLKDELACSLMQDAPRSKVSAIENRIRLAWDALEVADDATGVGDGPASSGAVTEHEIG